MNNMEINKITIKTNMNNINLTIIQMDMIKTNINKKSSQYKKTLDV